jgi:hypothetical protein
MQTPEHESGDTIIERRDSASTSIEPRRPRDRGSRSTAAGSSPADDHLKRLLTSRGGTLRIVIAIAMATIALTRLAPHAARPDRELEADEPLGDGMVVRYELLDLWLPETLFELAREPSRAPALRDHQDLKRVLELRNEQDLWYALTERAHQVDGGFVDITVIRRPYHDPEWFPEFLAVLATVGGDPPRDSDTDFSTASIHIIPVELATREPRGAIAELLIQPLTPAAHGCAR